jgi:quercetin dioxygenase-like cupin family protein
VSIHRWNPAVDGPLSEQALRRKLEAMGYTLARYVYSPGTHFPEHTHAFDKADAVVSGRFRLELSGEIADLGPGDWIAVPRGVKHSATVLGDEPVISLDGARRTHST